MLPQRMSCCICQLYSGWAHCTYEESRVSVNEKGEERGKGWRGLWHLGLHPGILRHASRGVFVAVLAWPALPVGGVRVKAHRQHRLRLHQHGALPGTSRC